MTDPDLLHFLQRVSALADACSDRPGAPDDIREAGEEIAEDATKWIERLFPQGQAENRSEAP